jgi:hypothetical protein
MEQRYQSPVVYVKAAYERAVNNVSILIEGFHYG